MRGDERLMDLLAARATEGLSRNHEEELDRELAGRDDLHAEEFEAAAAAIYLAFEATEGGDEAMPDDLKRRILGQEVAADRDGFEACAGGKRTAHAGNGVRKSCSIAICGRS